MKKKWMRAALILLALTMALLPALALADGGNSEDSAGNAFVWDGSASNLNTALDLYAVGQDVLVTGSTVGQSALLAGQNITLSGTTLGGSLRAAGSTLTVSDASIGGNATMAGYSIRFGSGATAKGLYAAGAEVSFSGACDALSVSAGTVTISGTVNGDANISANQIILTDDAVITGTLHAAASSQPQQAAGAKIGVLDFELVEANKSDITPAQAVAAPLMAKLVASLLLIPGRIVLALAMFLIFHRQISDAAQMAVSRPVAMPVSGLVTLISVPLGMLMLTITVIGIPAGLLAGALYGLILAFAATFAGCAAARLVFPKMKPIVACIVGAAAVSVLRGIPVLGSIVGLVCSVYALGYFVQKVYLNLPGKQAVQAPVQQAEAPSQEQA